MAQKRVIALPVETSVLDDDFLGVDSEENGSRRLAVSTVVGEARDGLVTSEQLDAALDNTASLDLTAHQFGETANANMLDTGTFMLTANASERTYQLTEVHYAARNGDVVDGEFAVEVSVAGVDWVALADDLEAWDVLDGHYLVGRFRGGPLLPPGASVRLNKIVGASGLSATLEVRFYGIRHV